MSRTSQSSAFFEVQSYSIGTDFLIGKGYLCPYSYPKYDPIIDASKVKVVAGRFDDAELEKVATVPQTVKTVASWWHHLAHDRKCTLAFCVSRHHAKLVKQAAKMYLPEEKTLYIDGDQKDRDVDFENIRAGKFKFIVNVGVLTTGFDAPVIDCILMARPTLSAGLFVQMAGRGLRQHPGKDNCLILDFAGNLERFCSIDSPKIKERRTKREKRDQQKLGGNLKVCEECREEIPIGALSCPKCGHLFIKHRDKPFTPGYSGVFRVKSIDVRIRQPHTGDDALVLYYDCGIGEPIPQWINYRNKNRFVRRKAQEFAFELLEKSPTLIEAKWPQTFPKEYSKGLPTIRVLEWSNTPLINGDYL